MLYNFLVNCNITRKVLIIGCAILMVYVCSGCNKKAHEPLQEANAIEYEKHLSNWLELSSFSGTIDHVQSPKYNLDPSITLSILAKYTGLTRRTNLIFHNLDENSYLYKKPGQNIKFNISEDFSKHTSIRYHLLELDEQANVVKTVFENITISNDLTIQLPEIENILYLLTLEGLDQQKEVIDAAIFIIEVVPQVINAELKLAPNELTSDQSIPTTIELINYGPHHLHFGNDYRIEKYENNNWYKLSLDLTFSSILNSLPSGEMFSQPFHLPPNLPHGKYRIIKSIEATGVFANDNQYKSINLAVEFTLD